MSLKEQFEYLVRNGFIKIAEEDSHNLYESSQYKSFIIELDSIDDRVMDVEDLEEQIDELEDLVDELKDKIDELKNN